MLRISVSYDVFMCKELPFRGCSDCTYLKIFSGIDFLIMINSLKC